MKRGEKPEDNVSKKRAPAPDSASSSRSKAKLLLLRGPELRAALMEESRREEKAMMRVNVNKDKNRDQEETVGKDRYRPPEFVAKFLSRNDVRPLKKVFLRQPFNLSNIS